MVVIAIVALLSAVATPAYRDYIIRTKVLEAIAVLERVAKDLQYEYNQKGVYPVSITFNGVTISSPSWGIVNLNKIYGISYAVSGSGVLLQASILGLDGISGYVTPSPSGIYSAKSTLSYTIKESNGIFRAYCGQYNDAAAIPLAYLPATCQCTNMTSDGGTCP